MKNKFYSQKALCMIIIMICGMNGFSQFSGAFAPANWNFNTTTAGGDGSVNTTGAPSSIILNGSDNGGGCCSQYEQFTTTIIGNGKISFDFSHVNPDIDDAQYVINGVVTNITSSGSGSLANILVNSGDVFSFRVSNYDNCCGRGVLTISNFVFTPYAGAALNFDGANDYVSIGTVIPLNSSYTKEAWVYANASGSNNIISSGSAAFWLAGGQLSTFNNGGSTIQDPAIFPLNQWVHVAVTFNSTNSLSSLYKNGILVASGISNSGYTNDAIAIGQYGPSSANFFQGTMDEVRIWNIARTQCEINSYMNCEIPTTATGLLANYHFNQGLDAANNSTVTTLVDDSGNSNTFALSNFALTGATSNWVAPGGVISGSITPSTCTPAAALNFDGADDYVMTSSNITHGNQFTYEAWINPMSANQWGGIMTTSSLASQAQWIQITLNSAGALRAEIVDDAGNNKWYDGNTSLLGAWHHIAVSFDGTNLLFYVDGNIETTSAINNGTLSTITINSQLNIGAERNHNVFYNGDIDEVRIWNVAKTQCEINTYKNCEITSSATGLVANYHFNQGVDAANNPTEINLMDDSGNSNTGTLNNFALSGTTSNWVAPGAVVSGYTTTLAPLLVNSTVTNSVICNGNSTTLSGTGANTYSWTNSVADATAFSPTITATYTVTGTNTLTGCSNTAVNTVTVNALPTIAVNSGAICLGQSFTMTPSGAATYTFSNGSAIATPTADATYSVSGTDANGCMSNVDAISSVTINALPTISVNSGAICTGNSFTMTPNGASTYTFSNGSAIASPTANATYSVSGTDANGCMSNVDAISSVTINALPTISVNSGAICTGNSFTMTPSGASTYTYSNGSAVVTPTVNASYNVTGTDVNGCISSSVAVSSVTVNALPMVMASTSNTLLCSGQTATLSVTGATSYTWSTSQTTSSIAVTPTIQTTYTVNGVDANGCVNTTTLQQNVSLCTSIQSLVSNQQSLISVYPNPTGGMVNVELEILNGTTVNIQILNTLGEILINEFVNTQHSAFNIQHFAAGVYFVKLIENNKQQVIKLIKQ